MLSLARLPGEMEHWRLLNNEPMLRNSRGTPSTDLTRRRGARTRACRVGTFADARLLGQEQVSK